MLKVLPIQSKAEQEELCRLCSIPYRPDTLMYLASVEGERVGVCQFKLTDKGGIIYDIAKFLDREDNPKSDNEALFVMGRGALNFIDLCGVHNASFIGESADEALLSAIGFKKNADGIYTMNLTGVFTDHCH